MAFATTAGLPWDKKGSYPLWGDSFLFCADNPMTSKKVEHIMGQQCVERFFPILSPDDQTAKNVLLQSFMHNTSDGIVIMDLDGRVLVVNRASEFMHGWKSEEVAGKVLPMTPPHLMEEAMALHQKVLAGEKVNAYETYNLKKDGSLIHVSVSISLIKDSQGTIIALILSLIH